MKQPVSRKGLKGWRDAIQSHAKRDTNTCTRIYRNICHSNSQLWTQFLTLSGFPKRILTLLNI